MTLFRQHHGLTRFALIVDLTHWQLAPPDVLKLLRNYNQTCIASGMEAKWIVSSDQNQLALHVAESMINGVVPFAHCSNSLNEAIASLKTEGFHPSDVEIRDFFSHLN
jgi:hypothetical protein